MTADKLANAILNKCDIYYGDALVSKEAIIEKYLAFFADSLVSKERTVNFALHTGSLCFDVISVVAVALGCLSYNLSTNEDIISSLQENDMVLFKGQRYRWKGTRKEYGNLCMVIEQDGKGKNGKSVSYLPLERNKHLIRPYYGDSQITDGRGVKIRKTNREDFLSFAFDVDVTEIPAQIDVAIVIVAERGTFGEICKQVRIVYGEGKSVSLLDIIPAAYYTSSGEEHQYGLNPTKAEPVLKVTSKISTARDLVLDKHGNKVVGLLVTGGTSLTENGSELADLLRRKVLRFAHVTSPMKAGMGEHILDMYEGASVFACTKELLSRSNQMIRSENPFTTELHRQIMNVIHNTVTPIAVPDGWEWADYRRIKNAILAVKQSNWQATEKDDFVVMAHGLLNLMNTAIFSMEVMEQAVQEGRINQAVLSPMARIAKLWDVADKAGSMQEHCVAVADALERKYQERLTKAPKADALDTYIKTHKGSRIAIIVPKAYYADILRITHPEYFEDDYIICVTANRFDPRQKYDAILCVGELNNKRFDPLQCLAARNINVLLYNCEEKVFTFRKRKQQKYERKLNRRIGATKAGDEPEDETIPAEEELELEVQQFSTLDEYIDSFNVFDIRKFAYSGAPTGGYIPVAEVKFVGAFVTGEQIFFSKYYSAVVFDSASGSVIEKTPEQLLPGDVLVFVKRDDYTKNIVDFIYERLLREGRLGQGAVDAYEKSQYWKEALREYKEVNGFTYRKVAQKMREAGSKMQEVTIRQWLIEDSHIVGPRNERTMGFIAAVTQDPHLLADPHGFFTACGAVRHDRRKILDLIAKAINDKLSGNLPPEGSVLSIVYDNVDSLSETMELEYVSELAESVNISVNLVNTPITEAEVSV